MRRFLKYVLFTFLLISFLQVKAQEKIVIIDHIELISDDLENSLIQKFSSQNLDYTTTVDYKERCNYHYAQIKNRDGDDWLIIEDCDNLILGKKKLSMSIQQMNVNDQAGMIVYMAMDIINNPSKKRIEPDSEAIAKEVIQQDSLLNRPNEHNSRYFFSPSAFNLKKGELYYNTVYFVLHDVQYGVTDHFSVGMGSTLGAFPFYLTPKYSFNISETSRAAIGDMFIIGTYGLNFTINLLYGTYTYGTEHHNLTLGGGWLYSPQNSIIDSEISKSILNIAGMTRLSDYIYFVSENYFFRTPSTISAFNQSQGIQTNFTVQNNFLFGFFGARFISKRSNVQSWQAGLAYFSRGLPEIPATYSNPAIWSLNYPRELRFFIPQISFTYKFGKKY